MHVWMVITWMSILPIVSEHGPGLSPAASVIPALPVETLIIRHVAPCNGTPGVDSPLSVSVLGYLWLMRFAFKFLFFFAFGSFNDTSVSFHSVRQIVTYPAVID